MITRHKGNIEFPTKKIKVFSRIYKSLLVLSEKIRFSLRETSGGRKMGHL